LAIETWLGVVRNAQRREKDRQTLEDIELAVLESDLLAALGQREQSLKLLQTLLDSFEQKRPGEGMERQVAARLLVEGSEILEEEVLLWRRYLAGWSPLPTMPSKSHWIFSYLRFRKGVESEFDFSAVTAETNARFKQLFLRESRHVLAARSLNRERYDRAADLYANLEQDAHGSAKAYYQTMQRLAKSSYSQSEK